MTRTVKQLHYLTSMVNAVKKKIPQEMKLKQLQKYSFFSILSLQKQ